MKKWQDYIGLIIALLVIVGVTLYPLMTGNAYNREVAFNILRVIALASSLNILLGYTGYVSFGHIVFYGFGGYMGFYLITAQNWNLFAAMLVGGLASGVLAFLLGKAVLRLRGAYFALATIGVNEAMKALISNLDLFGGPIGMSLHFSVYKDYGGAPKALEMSFYIMAVLAAAVIITSYFVRVSKFGLSLLAIREDEDAAEVVGIVTPNAKTWAYVLSAVFPGIIGVLFFFKQGNVEPAPAFMLHSSIEWIVMVMLGGQGTVLGPILGALGYQQMRGFLLTNDFFKDIQLSVSGVLLLIIVLFVPDGVIGFLRKTFPQLRKVLQ